MFLFKALTGAVLASILSTSSAQIIDSLWVTSVPNYVRPYAIQHQLAAGCIIGQQVYRFPVTGPSSNNAFTLISTNAPGSTSLGVLPHVHQIHYENFFSLKGGFQLWTEKDGDSETRVLGQGDFGAVPRNTTHTFQILEPDTEMVGVIQPGGFEKLFFALSSSNYSSSTLSPYDPSTPDTPQSIPSGNVTSSLQIFDVYAQLDFVPRNDTVNGKAPTSAIWHDGNNTLGGETTPYYVAKDRGPKYLNSGTGGYQLVQPLVTPVQSGGDFTLSTISIQKTNTTGAIKNFPGHAAFEVLEGMLSVTLAAQTVDLLQGDVVFIPGNTSFTYGSKVAFTKFLAIGQGSTGLATELVNGGKSWASPVWPIA